MKNILFAVGIVGVAVACINYFLTLSNDAEGKVMNVEDGFAVEG